MNQTKKRLSIINLAISITDIETIQLQILQLGPLRTDEKIQEIITALKAENYVQAQGLITAYIETPTKVILQRTFQKEQEKRKIQDNNTIDEFNLFTEPEDSSEIKNLDFDDMVELSDDIEEKKPKEVRKNIDFDSLLNIDAGDILPNNIKLKTSHTSSNTFWDEPEKPNMHTDDIPKDTFFDTEESVSVQEQPKKEATRRPIDEDFTVPSEESHKETIQEEHSTKDIPDQYRAIPYINQKFKNMHVQYPPAQETLEIFPSVTAWLEKISHEGYCEEDIEKIKVPRVI